MNAHTHTHAYNYTDVDREAGKPLHKVGHPWLFQAVFQPARLLFFIPVREGRVLYCGRANHRKLSNHMNPQGFQAQCPKAPRNCMVFGHPA